MVYVGYICEELETRLTWHKNNYKCQVYKYKNDKPVIKLIVNAPCRDRKELEKFEKEYIKEYWIKYSDKFLNKRCNPLHKPGLCNSFSSMGQISHLKLLAGQQFFSSLLVPPYQTKFLKCPKTSTGVPFNVVNLSLLSLALS